MRRQYRPAIPRASTSRRRPRAADSSEIRDPEYFRRENDFASVTGGCPCLGRNPIFRTNDAHGCPVPGRLLRGRGRHARPPGGAVIRPAILIVDHEETSRSHLKERIAAVCPPGMEVLAASSAEEALGVLYSLREQSRP